MGVDMPSHQKHCTEGLYSTSVLFMYSIYREPYLLQYVCTYTLPPSTPELIEQCQHTIIMNRACILGIPIKFYVRQELRYCDTLLYYGRWTGNRSNGL